MHIYMYIYIYIHIYTQCMCIYIYIYIYVHLWQVARRDEDLPVARVLLHLQGRVAGLHAAPLFYSIL